ncbi:hypothetical protein FDUTEX481_07612 [Tolypothrix sp. PCC 7601]|nr:hypothetical protein FDUTEX481_07612 [Tolypothrix sp. PCC 7601]
MIKYLKIFCSGNIKWEMMQLKCEFFDNIVQYQQAERAINLTI